MVGIFFFVLTEGQQDSSLQQVMIDQWEKKKKKKIPALKQKQLNRYFQSFSFRIFCFLMY